MDALAHALTDQESVHILAAGGALIHNGEIQIPIENQRQSAWDWRGGHDQKMRTFTLGSQCCALGDAKAVLLVGDDEAQILKLHRLRE